MIAKAAVESHYEHELRSGEYHFGSREYTIVELLDDEEAKTLEESEIGLSVEQNHLKTRSGDTREVTFPRTCGTIDGIVSRGDMIELARGKKAKVARVAETRSLGLPTWTVIYVAPEVNIVDANPKQDYRWLNECIVVDGRVYCRYEPSEPRFEVIGESEHQASLERFSGGVSA